MKKILLVGFILLVTQQVQACLHLKAVWTLNEKDFRINQKVENGKTYSFTQDNFLLHLIPQDGIMKYKIQSRHKTSLSTISQGDLVLKGENEVQVDLQNQTLKMTVVHI